MKQIKKANFLLVIVLLGVVVAFAYSYNAYLTTIVADAAYNDRDILQKYNNEVISKLIEEESVSSWSEIVEQYEDVVIVIENSSNKVVTKSIGRTWSTLDVKVQTPFEYKGEAYLIKSSVYLLRDYEKTGNLRRVSLRGYAGNVYNRFISLTENLERQNKNQQRIIASISHDIKTPLTSIMGYAEQLKKDTIPEGRRKRYLETVYGKSVEIQQLVDEFDEYLSFNMSQEMRKEEISAEEIRKLLVYDYADELENQGVDFTVSKCADNAVVLVDKQKIKRVLGNIFSNSLKHFKSERRRIDVDISCDKDSLILEISDSGEGVPQEKLDMIFEPLYTSDEGRKVAGLGLSICREIIDAHSGKIYAKPSKFGGLAVVIELERTDKKPTPQQKLREAGERLMYGNSEK